MAQATIGLVGLAVMGRNLALNIAEKGHTVAIHNRSPERITETLNEAGPLKDRLVPATSYADLVSKLAAPRSIILMVQAGAPVDMALDDLIPLLSPGDCVIDCGNANWRDTVAREKRMSAAGLDFLGVGVSGGEEGARHGPAIMAGGSAVSYARVEPVFDAIAARFKGEACAARVGTGGAGHFVKTIHNGIEYADMAMIAEIYGVLRYGLGLAPAEIAPIFKRWNDGPLGSYLIEITADILARTDAATAKPVVDIIVDSAGQKGTGKWSAIDALDLAVPASAIAASVEARITSSLASLRSGLRARFGAADATIALGDRTAAIDACEQALLAGKIAAYAQGFSILAAASEANSWSLPLGTVARIWRAGCIIRSAFLDTIATAFDADASLPSLMLDKDLSALFATAEPSMRKVIATSVLAGRPVPVLAASLTWFDSLRPTRATADLVQAQRDYFGAHGFGRIDQPGQHHGTWDNPVR